MYLACKRGDKRGAQSEDHVAFQVFVLGLGDARTFLRALQAQFALVFALMQVTEVRLFSSALKGSPDSIVRRDLCAVRRKVNCGLGRR